MGTQTVSLTIAVDWEALTARDFRRMDKARTMFAELTVDTYGRTHGFLTKVWIVQGTTSHNFASFATHLAAIFDIDSVLHLSVTQQAR